MVSRRGGVHGGPGHVANAIGFLEDREGTAARVEHRGPQFFARQVGGGLDAAFLERHDRSRGVVVDHHDGHRLVGGVGVVGVELHQGGQIGKAHVVRARGHARDRTAGAVARIHRHIQLGLLEIAFGRRVQEQRRGAFKAPVELKFDRGGLGVCGAESGSGDQRCAGLDEKALVHGGSWAIQR
jgi:hypothetical protein